MIPSKGKTDQFLLKNTISLFLITKASIKESDILRMLVEREIKSLSVDDLLKTMEIDLGKK